MRRPHEYLLDELADRSASRQHVVRRDQRLDALSRGLSSRLSRRTAFGVVAGAFAAARAVRPLLAYADSPCPPGTTECTRQNLDLQQIVCAPAGAQCCNTDRCAGACSEAWKVCKQAGSYAAHCDDTAAMCSPPYQPTSLKFCSTTYTQDSQGTCAGGYTATVGWCCPPGSGCGSQTNDCTCDGTQCNTACCHHGFECDPGSTPECKKLCDDGRPRCGNECCTSNRICTGAFSWNKECECNPPLVACGSGCCKDTATVKDPGTNGNAFWNMVNMAEQTSANHGGNHELPRALAPAASALAAVDVLAALSGQRGIACQAFSDGHHDSAYTKTVTIARPKLAKIQAGTGFDAGSAAAIAKLATAEAHASAQIYAAATALARSRAAGANNDHAHRSRQLKSSATLAGQAVKTLKTIPALRAAAGKALAAGGVPDVFVTGDQVAALVASVHSGGLPATLHAQLAALGLDSHAIGQAKAAIVSGVAQPDSLGGSVLVGPLTGKDDQQALSWLTSELDKYAKRTRHSPLARG